LNKKFNFTLKKKFTLLYIAFILIPFLLLGHFFFSNAVRYMKENIIHRSQSGFKQTNQLVAYYMYNVNDSMNSLVFSDDLHKIIERDENTLNDIDKSSEANRLRNLLSSYSMKNEIEELILYLDKEATYISEDSIVKPLSIIKDTQWYQYAVDNFPIVTIIPPSIMEDKDKIAYLKPVREFNNYTSTIGILRFDISKSVIVNMLEELLQSPEDFTYIINNNGNIICESGDSCVYIPFEDIEKYNDEKVHEVEINNNTNIVYVKAIENTNWYLVYVIPYSRILSNMYSQSSLFLVIFAILVISGFVFAYFFFKLFLNRVFVIKEHMSNIHTELPSPLPIPKQKDEISDLVEAYNYMLSRMSILLMEEYSLGNQIKEAEMKALYEQINPHFLYNTLAMIDWLAEEGQQEDVSRVISALSSFYRISLNKGNENIYLRDELKIIESFIYIQNMRFGTDILLEYNIDDIYENIILPKLILQPLVENALVHGILKKRNKKGFICITVNSDKNNIHIVVSDNGVGIAPDTLELLNNGILLNNGQHYGVKNIMQRLTLYYGKECFLLYESNPDILTKVTLTIPYI